MLHIFIFLFYANLNLIYALRENTGALKTAPSYYMKHLHIFNHILPLHTVRSCIYRPQENLLIVTFIITRKKNLI